MSYTDSPACQMLSTHCLVCGRPLVDARSITIGVGPECRRGIDGGIDDAVREQANKLIFEASVAANHGHLDAIRAYAESIRELGLDEVADKIEKRFCKAAENKPDIVIKIKGNNYIVKTPFRRAKSDDFIAAWQGINGRYFDYKRQANVIPVTEREALWSLLRRFFSGKYGTGPQGAFRVPQPEPNPQLELALEI